MNMLPLMGAAMSQPQYDKFGVQMPPQPGQQIGTPGYNPNAGLMGHMGGMMGGGQQMDPTVIQMILKLLGMGQQQQQPMQGQQ